MNSTLKIKEIVTICMYDTLGMEIPILVNEETECETTLRIERGVLSTGNLFLQDGNRQVWSDEEVGPDTVN